MKINQMQKKGYELLLEIEEDYSKIESQMEAVFKDEVAKVKIPGFRNGKAPREVYEKYYGKGTLLEKAMNRVMTDCYQMAIKENSLEPVDHPKKVDIKKIDEGKPFVFELAVDVKPEVKLGKYKGFQLTSLNTDVSDQEIVDEIEKYRKQNGVYVDFEAESMAENEDHLVLNMMTRVEDTAYGPWTSENKKIVVGGGEIHALLDQALIGMKIGAEKELEIAWEDTLSPEELKGKKVFFKFKIISGQKRKLPELDDEFAKKISDRQSMVELKALIAENLKLSKKEKSDQKLQTQLFEELVKNTEIDLPKGMIEEELKQIQQNMEENYKRYGLNFTQFLSYQGKNLEQWKTEMEPAAKKNVQVDLILESIGVKEKLEVSDDELKAEIQKMYEQFPSKDKIKEELYYDIYKKSVKTFMQRQKSIEWVKTNSKIKEE